MILMAKERVFYYEFILINQNKLFLLFCLWLRLASRILWLTETKLEHFCGLLRDFCDCFLESLFPRAHRAAWSLCGFLLIHFHVYWNYLFKLICNGYMMCLSSLLVFYKAYVLCVFLVIVFEKSLSLCALSNEKHIGLLDLYVDFLLIHFHIYGNYMFK